jgi:DnaK suppressor protein
MTSVVHITIAQTEQLRQELLRNLAKLEKSVGLIKTASSAAADLDPSAVGRLSRIEALQNQGLTNGLKERERIQFEQVRDALSRMEEGMYGKCTSCRSPIPVERLAVFPETRTCTGCG